MLTAYVEVYLRGDTRLTEVTANVARPDQNGRSRELQPSPVTLQPDRVGFATRLPLSDLPAGDYVLTFSAEAGNRTARRQIPFSIADR